MERVWDVSPNTRPITRTNALDWGIIDAPAALPAVPQDADAMDVGPPPVPAQPRGGPPPPAQDGDAMDMGEDDPLPFRLRGGPAPPVQGFPAVQWQPRGPPPPVQGFPAVQWQPRGPQPPAGAVSLFGPRQPRALAAPPSGFAAAAANNPLPGTASGFTGEYWRLPRGGSRGGKRTLRRKQKTRKTTYRKKRLRFTK